MPKIQHYIRQKCNAHSQMRVGNGIFQDLNHGVVGGGEGKSASGKRNDAQTQVYKRPRFLKIHDFPTQIFSLSKPPNS